MRYFNSQQMGDPKIRELFMRGAASSQVQPTKVEQRFNPRAVGDTALARQNRQLTPAERHGLVPVQGDSRRYPVRNNRFT